MAKDSAIFIDNDKSGLEKAIKLALNIDDGSYGKMKLAANKNNLERSWDKTGKSITELYNDLFTNY